MAACLVVVSPFGDYATGDVIFNDIAAIQASNRNCVVPADHPLPDAPVIAPAPEPIPEPTPEPAAPAEEH